MLSSEHLYLEIDIPSKGELNTKVLPIDKASITQTINPPGSSHNPEGSMAIEVNHLLDRPMAEASNGRSEQFSLERITTEDAPQKSEATTPPVNTSSQASAEEAEESLEDIPANISPIATVYSSGSASAPEDLSELQANVNRAIDNMLHLKRSLDVKRYRATWELGVLLHQNESQGAAFIVTAKAIYSQAVLDAKTSFQVTVMEAKTCLQVTVMEAKTTTCHSIQAAEVACSKAISEAKTWITSQAIMLQEEHSRYMQSLEEQAFEEESRSHHEVLSSCPAALYHSQQSFRGPLAASYHLLLGQAPPSSTPILPPRTPSMEEQPSTTTPPAPTPKQSPRPKRWLPSPELTGNMPLGRATLLAALGGPSNPKKQENPPWFKLLKPSHADAFLRDSDIVMEARLCFFSKYSHNFDQDSTHDLSKVFKKLAMKAGLLGTNIYEIEASSTGLEELKQANYTLWSLPKGLKFLRVVSTLESPKIMGLEDAHHHFVGFTY